MQPSSSRSCRVTIEISRDVQDQLEAIARERRSDLYAELNRAVGLYLLLMDKTRGGELVGVARESGGGDKLREILRL